MSGIYINIKPLNRPFLFREGEVNRSVRLACFTFIKVGKFDPLSFKGNVMIGTKCLVDWRNED